jgi:predicted amidophosphoribosyltransferase
MKKYPVRIAASKATDADWENCIWKDVVDSPVIIYGTCPECKQLVEFEYGEVGCEDCGNHAAIMCPECNERWDSVFSQYDAITEYNTTRR